MTMSFCPGSTLVPITAPATGSAPLGTRSPAECTVNVTSTGKARPATSPTAGTTAAAPTTATATSPGRSCACATTAGKVRVGSVRTSSRNTAGRVALLQSQAVKLSLIPYALWWLSSNETIKSVLADECELLCCVIMPISKPGSALLRCQRPEGTECFYVMKLDRIISGDTRHVFQPGPHSLS